MLSKRKFVMPETTDLDGASREVTELVAFVEALTDSMNAAYEQILALEAEVARLKKAKKRQTRTPK